MPHLAVVALTVIAIILILIFVRFRFDRRFAKIVYLALDALIVVFPIGRCVWNRCGIHREEQSGTGLRLTQERKDTVPVYSVLTVDANRLTV